MAEQQLGSEPPNKRAKIDPFQASDPTGELSPGPCRPCQPPAGRARGVGADEEAERQAARTARTSPGPRAATLTWPAALAMAPSTPQARPCRLVQARPPGRPAGDSSWRNPRARGTGTRSTLVQEAFLSSPPRALFPKNTQLGLVVRRIPGP